MVKNSTLYLIHNQTGEHEEFGIIDLQDLFLDPIGVNKDIHNYLESLLMPVEDALVNKVLQKIS